MFFSWTRESNKYENKTEWKIEETDELKGQGAFIYLYMFPGLDYAIVVYFDSLAN